MNLQSERRGVWVGLLVTVGTLVLVAALFAVGAGGTTFVRTTQVHATFDHVEGLREGDNVSYAGIVVGEVGELQLADRRVEVTLELRRKLASSIPSDAQVRIQSDGLIGERLVELVGGEAAAGLTEGARLATAPSATVETMLADLHETQQELHQVVVNARALTEGVRAGEGTLGRLLVDDALADDVEATAGSLRLTAERAARAARDVAALTAQAATPGRLPHQIVHDEETWPALVGARDDVVETAERVRERLARPDTALGVLTADAEAGEDVAVTLDQLRRSSVLLEEDLKALQSNFLLRGYFKKQVRREREEAEGN